MRGRPGQAGTLERHAPAKAHDKAAGGLEPGRPPSVPTAQMRIKPTAHLVCRLAATTRYYGTDAKKERAASVAEMVEVVPPSSSSIYAHRAGEYAGSVSSHCGGELPGQ